MHGTITAYETTQKPVAITWTAFPNLVKVKNPHEPKRWIVADSNRDMQDEYLEWSVKRDDSEDKRIVVVTYTCEGPEVRVPGRTRSTQAGFLMVRS